MATKGGENVAGLRDAIGAARTRHLRAHRLRPDHRRPGGDRAGADPHPPTTRAGGGGRKDHGLPGARFDVRHLRTAACLSGHPPGGGRAAHEGAQCHGTRHLLRNPPPGSTILAEVAPRPTEPKVTGRADKFYGTPLDDILKSKGIKTLVIVGTAANGAVLYTAFGANVRGYTVVVATDGISADPFPMFLTQYQLLNQPGFANPENTPLAENKVTLSRSDLITFR